MKINFLKEKNLDLLLISRTSISYFKLKSGKIFKSEVIKVNLYEKGIFQKDILESIVISLIKKYKLSVLGIIIHLPSIFYQRVTINKSSDPYQAIYNYLKVSLPLSLEKYNFFYKEDRYGISSTSSNYNVVFINKEIVENLLKIVEKHNLIPLFISPSLEVVYEYMLAKSIINFNGEYIVFFVDNDILLVLLIKQLRIEKVLLEEIDIESSNLDLIINRFYSFLKMNASNDVKVVFSAEKDLSNLFNNISSQTISIAKPFEILISGSNFLFEKVFSDQEFIDFLPIKSYSAYFLTRLPSIIFFLTFYLFSVFVVISTVFLIFNFFFNKEIATLSKNQLNQIVPLEIENKINSLLKLEDKIDYQIITNFDKIKSIINLENLKNLSLNDFKNLSFSIITKKDNLEKIKFEINQIFPEIKLIQEENISDTEVKLNYSF